MTTQPNSIRSTDYRQSNLAPQELVDLIEAGRRAAEDFQHEDAIEKLSVAAASPLLNTEQKAKVRCVLAESLENLARYREALALLADYESVAGRAGLSQGILVQLWLRLGSLQGYVGDYPRAISYLKSTLTLAEKRENTGELGACHMILGRIYRAIGETQFARDHLRVALNAHRKAGQWSALAQNYFLLGNVYVSEGEMQDARENYEQAIKIIADRRAPLLLGSIYTSLSNLILLQEYGQAKEGVETLEKAIHYLKEAKNDRLLAYAYSNLGFVLTNLGLWSRARQILNFAIELGRVNDKRAYGTALDTLGELFMLQGDLDEAESTLRESMQIFQKANFPYGEVQAVQTLGRCLLAQGKYPQALETFKQQLALADRVEDKRSRCAAQVYLAQTQVESGNHPLAQTLLDRVAEEIDFSANISLVAHFRTVSGMLHVQTGQEEEAQHEFGQAITVFSMVADRYRESVARYHLGQTLVALGETARARRELRQAYLTGKELGAKLLLSKASQALEQIDAVDQPPVPATRIKDERGAVSNAVVLRLIRAASSQELLLHELTILLHEITGWAPIIIYEEREGQLNLLAETGGERGEGEEIKKRFASELRVASSNLGEVSEEAIKGETCYKLRLNSKRLIAFIGTREARGFNRHLVEPLFRLAEMGLALIEKRAKLTLGSGTDELNLLPEITPEGAVFASPPMRALVDEIHKIRSSRVTTLITGESGTGKEVVARLIHSLSERRQKPFVAFNCTIASPEIVNSQLFGHKKGSFTGAVSDTVGVISSANGGTLFLDEIGDLALDVQPKLLRFLQEGEIHRLGETTPTRVDVRVLAATNADLEKLVAAGKFREDLYYRLNIIRLRIPPLRERREEISLLIDHYLRIYSQQSNKTAITIDQHTLDLLMVYDWPGNVRQLANELQRLVAYKDSGEIITASDLSSPLHSNQKSLKIEDRTLTSVTETLLHNASPVQLDYKPGGRTLGNIVDELESQIILESMRRHQGRRNAVCEELGITRKGLYLKLRRLPGIDLAEFGIRGDNVCD